MRRATLLLLPMLLLFFPAPSQAQNVDVSGGWAHVSGDNGTDGFNIAASVWVTSRISVGGFFDDAWDNSTLGNFSLTPIGQIATKSHLENYMFGPRVFFGKKKFHKMEWVPFADAHFGGTHLRQQLVAPTLGLDESASANGFSWMVGGGADYVFSRHFAFRGNLDFLRTHLANEGQSRYRFVLGIVYSFKERGL